MASPLLEMRFRCTGCGNLTRFDIVATRRTRAFHHFSVGGDLEIEDEVVLESQIDEITCRWCGASGGQIETLESSPRSSPRSSAQFDPVTTPGSRP